MFPGKRTLCSNCRECIGNASAGNVNEENGMNKETVWKCIQAKGKR